MAKSMSFHQAVAATAMQKAAAAKARRQSAPAAEKPRDVIFSACRTVADSLADDGFAFLKSGPTLKRVDGDLTYTIHFQSDRNNIAGLRAAVWIHAGISSRRLAKWRMEHPLPCRSDSGPWSGTISGGQIGNLLAAPSWMEWNFADESRRADEIDDAVSAIRRIILPFFAMFDEPAAAVDLLIHRSALPTDSLLEYALMALGRETAEAAGRSFLGCNPEVRRRFEAAVARFRKEGLASCRSETSHDLAILAIAYGLDFGAPSPG